jgi:hypothetical protein
MGRGSIQISEDAGESWQVLKGVSLTAIYGRKVNAALAYEGERLIPIGSTNQAVYRYSWPSLSQSGISVTIPVPPGCLDPVSVRGALQLGEDADGIPWHVGEGVDGAVEAPASSAGPYADWLSVSPKGWMLPSDITFTVDPTQVTQSVEQTTVTLDVHWSRRQVDAMPVSVQVLLAEDQMWLPLVMH